MTTPPWCREKVMVYNYIKSPFIFLMWRYPPHLPLLLLLKICKTVNLVLRSMKLFKYVCCVLSSMSCYFNYCACLLTTIVLTRYELCTFVCSCTHDGLCSSILALRMLGPRSALMAVKHWLAAELVRLLSQVCGDTRHIR